jgi:hypothetical protein
MQTFKTIYFKSKKINFFKKDSQIFIEHTNGDGKQVIIPLLFLVSFLKNKDKFVTSYNKVHIKKFNHYFQIDCLKVENKEFRKIIGEIG